MSIYALAKKTGLTTQGLSRLEKGGREPTWGTVQLLAAALGVSCEEFTGPVNLPEQEPARKPGRPPKPAAAKPAAKRGRGKPRKKQ